MKTVSFGTLFATGAGGLFVALVAIAAFSMELGGRSGDLDPRAYLGAALVAVAGGLVFANLCHGETILRRSNDLKALFRAIEVSLAERGYKLEIKTEALVIYARNSSPPQWLKVGVYLLPDEETLRIVGPAYVLKHLREV